MSYVLDVEGFVGPEIGDEDFRVFAEEARIAGSRLQGEERDWLLALARNCEAALIVGEGSVPTSVATLVVLGRVLRRERIELAWVLEHLDAELEKAGDA